MGLGTQLRAKRLRSTTNYVVYQGVLGEREIDLYIPRADFREVFCKTPEEAVFYCNSRRVKNPDVEALQAEVYKLKQQVFEKDGLIMRMREAASKAANIIRGI